MFPAFFRNWTAIWHIERLDFIHVFTKPGKRLFLSLLRDRCLCYSVSWSRQKQLHQRGKKWFPLNSKIWRNLPSKFTARSPLVANFRNELNTVRTSDLKNGGLDQRAWEEVLVPQSFGIVAYILRHSFKPNRALQYQWLIDAITEMELLQEDPQIVSVADSRSTFSFDHHMEASNFQRIQDENLKLRADLALLMA